MPRRGNVKKAKRNAGKAATLVWWLASSPKAALKQQTRAEVEKILVDAKLVDQMKALDQWDEWKRGQRGFPAGN